MKKIISSKNIFSISLSLGVLCFSQAVSAAWTNPGAAAPGGNVAAPINVGGVSQTKNGDLGANQFCLPAGANGGCISSWPSGGGGMSIGGTVTDGTLGSVYFGGASGALAQDNTNFFWNDTTNRLGLGGVSSPAARLDVLGGIMSNGIVSTTGIINVGAANDATIGTINAGTGDAQQAGDIAGQRLCIGSDCRGSWPSSGGSGTVTSVVAGTGLSGGTITTTGTISLDSTLMASGCGDSTTGKVYWNGSRLVCGTDVGGGSGDNLGAGNTGTANYVTKWTGAGSTIGNSMIRDNGSGVGIGTAPVASVRLEVGSGLTYGMRANGTLYGIYSISGSTGVYGGGAIGVYGLSGDALGYGVSGHNSGTGTAGVGVRGSAVSGAGGMFSSNTGYALVTGKGGVYMGQGVDTKLEVSGKIVNYETSLSVGTGISSYSTNGTGVYGRGATTGVFGYSAAAYGVKGTSDTSVGVDGGSASGTGVRGWSGTGAGIAGWSMNGFAGDFSGRVRVTDTLYTTNLNVSGTTTLACPCGTCWAMQGFDAGCGMAPSFGGYRMCTPVGWRDTYPGVGGC